MATADELETNKNLVRRFVDEIWNKGNVDAADEILDENLKLHGVNYTPTRDGEKAFVTAYRKAFPDMHFRITDIVAEGDVVSIQLQGKGTHKGDWQGIKATNNPITVNGNAKMTIRGGKIVESVHNPDLVGVRHDMGVRPTPAEAFKKRVY